MSPHERVIIMKPCIHLALVCMTVSLAVGGVARAADDERQAVHAAIGQFHEALNVLFTGEAGPMKAVWSHADDVTYMGPVGSVLVGWRQVEPYWDMQAARRLGGKVDPTDVHVIVSSGLAVASYREKGENVIDGKPQPVSIRSTTTFRKEGGQWKVVGHHTDPLAYLKK